ncbi:MAG: hypothetical protein H0U27_09935 [Nitrosopumilus sp.]|nr:hypothetical protein [Nitrosopumilus sp.]
MTVPLNNLVIEEGQVLNIPPRFYQYDTIYIKDNGLLKVNDNGSKWLILKAKIIICEGSIEYTNFRRGLGTIALTLENGDKLEHTFNEGLGGSSGNGSGNGRQQGGLGYRPDDYIGGGGGSGAYFTGNPSVNLPGITATDFRGAPSPSGNRRCFGGNGTRQAYGHGGLIYILAEKIIFNSSAKIVLRGITGANGAKGGSGDCYGGGQIYYWGGGGGGGGTAGGNGGVLIVKCDDITTIPIVDVNPGKGGIGGVGGTGGRCTFRGQDGTSGDNGEQGYADWQ